MRIQPLDEEAIFKVACGIESPEVRQDYLKQACGEDAVLFDRVATLLRAHDEDSGFLESPAVAPTLDIAPIAEKPGMKIGRYELVHEIGQGGMGVVYMAVQKEPVKRKVALKIIKPGMDTKEVVTRFEAERQALAMMDHQCIAHVLDGGSAESGRPYFVMELVEGTPIHEYCDACRYTTRQRLELFIQVCQAVQHAHLKGVIHRDIKPSNILVTTDDTVAVPKVIDFGIAKAVHQPLTDASVYTNISQMVGTPLYMSPEQAQRTAQDVDTRADVYSLGVLLYELLTGTTPFDKERFQVSSLDEVKRIIREVEPPKPSTRLTTVDAVLDTIAETHQTDLRTLTQELSGELDWIVMKAMEKDLTRRYESARDLAKDVQRYLDDEPVEACPPSTTYRLGKFYRRNKVALAFTGALALTLLIGAGIATAQAIRATKAERIAKQQERLALKQQQLAEEAAERERTLRIEAEQQRQRAEDNLRLAMKALDEIFLRVTETGVSGAKQTEEQKEAALLRGALDFYHRFTEVNKTVPELRLDVERAYLRLIALHSKLVSDLPHVLGYRRALASTCVGFAGLLQRADRLEEAEQLLQQGLAVRQDLAEGFPGVWEFSAELAEINEDIATLCDLAGNAEKAREHREQAEATRRQTASSDEMTSLQGVTFTDFADPAGLQLVSDATIAHGRLQVSLDEGPSCGAAWFKEMQLVALGFETSFSFEATTDGYGGLVFVIQNHASSALGGRGSGLGYSGGDGPNANSRLGIPNSLAIEFDPTTHPDNVTAQRGNHVSVHTRGTAPNSGQPDASLGCVFLSIQPFDGRPHEATIRYLPGTLEVFLDDLSQPILMVDVNLETLLELDNGRAWVGFTATTARPQGSSKDVLEWRFRPSLKDTALAVVNNATRNTFSLDGQGGQIFQHGDGEDGNELDDPRLDVSGEDVAFLQKALAFYEQLASLNSDAPEIRQEVGRAYWRTADIHSRLERPVEAFEARLAALRMWRELADEFPHVQQYESLWQKACLAATEPVLPATHRDQAIAELSDCIHSAPDRPEAYFLYLWRAKLYKEEEKHDLATADFSQVIDRLTTLVHQYPQNAAYPQELGYAHFQRGDVAFHRQEYDKALPDFDRAIYFRPDHAEALGHRGWIYHNRKQLDLALADLDRSIRLAPAWTATFGTRAYVHADMGEMDKAIADLDEWLRRRPNRAWVHDRRAGFFNRYGEYDLALEDCNRAIQLDPCYAPAYGNRGLAYHFQGDYQRALDNCSRSIRLDPEEPLHYSSRGQTYASLYDYHRAEADFSEAMQRGPQSVYVHYRLALVRVAVNDLDGYRAACAEMLDQFGQSDKAVDAYLTAWSCSLAPGALADLAPAIALAQRATESKPDSVFYRLTRGAILYRAGRFEDAVQHLKKSEEGLQAAEPTEPTSPAYLWFFLAMYHDRLGQKDEAARYLAAALERMEAELQTGAGDGSPQLAWNRRATLRLLFEESKQLAAFADVSEEQSARLAALLESGRPRISPDYYEKAQAYADSVEIGKDDPMSWRRRGDFYAKRARWEKAAEDYVRAIELDPSDHWPWYRLGALRLQLGDLSGHRQVCREMLKRFGDTDDAGIAERTAKLCLLVVEAVDDLELPSELADRSIIDGGKRWCQLVKGMAEYRLGKFESAIEWLRKARQTKVIGGAAANSYLQSRALLFQATAHHRLRQTDMASDSLAEAREIMETKFPRVEERNMGSLWHEWIFAHVVRREAEKLLNTREENSGNTTKERPRQERE